MIDQAGREVLVVAKTQGIDLPADALQRSSALLDSLPAGATTSLQRDVMEGRPSELDAQAGALGASGRAGRRRHGRCTPSSTTACCRWRCRRAAKSAGRFKPQNDGDGRCPAFD